jgi:hypothetical protein
MLPFYSSTLGLIKEPRSRKFAISP